MKRRQALQQIVGVSAGLMLPTWLAGCSDKDPQPEIQYDGVVGIIGAGAAGLHAADILRSKGVKVRIFEASSVLGGRVRTLRQFDQPTASLQFSTTDPPISKFPFELGASFIEGTDGELARIVSQLKVPVIDFSSLGEDVYVLDGIPRLATEVTDDADVVAAREFFESLKMRTEPVTVQSAITSAGINPRVQAILNGWIGNRHGTVNDKLGLKGVAEAATLLTRNTHRTMLRANPMQDVVLSRFSNVLSLVELNSAVTGIQYSGGKVILTGQRTAANAAEPFTAEVDRVIITAPVSVLKAGMMTFNPPLPDTKTAALSRMEMEAALRVRLEFRKNFWGTQTNFIYGGVQAPEYFNAGIGRDDQFKTLDITIQGPRAAELSALGQEMVPVLLQELDGMFAGQATESIRRDPADNILSVIMDWTKEEYIRGGMAYSTADGSNQDRVELAAPVNGVLFFAGEATDTTGDAGTLNGALLSAQVAALALIETIV
ncbi:FAD-dependent oxidoreductase [Fulvivirgaceae bacterium PWU5]|uniref:Tryptophan 2-monooxygenase n=1 Tax=Dawidia cretensis TaxID=2782350 RepID=A0AAP2E0Y1_9BACT|nr:FAD-dependent oxidoreductase [Dawidia cretensis]MBT1709489.1 FAD-dependent oxidoreductase [Dawidia cretensis]